MAEVPHPKTSPTSFYITRSDHCIGNGVFASADFGLGEHVAGVRRPLIASLDTERLRDTCANCYVWTEGSFGSRLYVQEGTTVQTCAGCKRFRYCSKACQKEAWTRGHKHECKNLKPVSDKNIPKGVLACMELLIRRKHGLIFDQPWELLCQLDSHIDDFKRNCKYGGVELMALGASQFSFTQGTFNKDFVAAMYTRILTNSLTLITPSYDPLGIVIDPMLCHLNHSCDPNAYIVMDGPEIAIRTLRPIKKDEEIYISYIDNTNPYARRQGELQSRWFFTCKCSKCQHGATTQEDKWAIEPKDLEKKWKDLADKMKTEDFAHDPANFVGDSQDEQRIAAIQGKAFVQYEEEQGIPDPAAALSAIEKGMRWCHETKLWPLYRQPYAAFRDDLIVYMLSIEDYQTAWAQCAKRYRYILPKLYPQNAHPVRVVQTWQMAMLALYLASTPEGIGAPGVDMGLMAYMLVIEVMHTSRASHGPNSAFSKSAAKKFDEITAELHSKLGPKADEIMASAVPAQRELLMEMGNWVDH